MSKELETRLEEAFAARATTTTTSDDAWARIHRRVARHDHRRSVVLRSVAAAAIVVLAVGGGVALFRDGGGSGTVATGGGDASKSIAEDSASSAAGGASEAAPAAPFVPAGNGLEVQQTPDGSIIVRLGSTTTAPVQPGGISAAIDGDTVFGVVPGGGAGEAAFEVDFTVPEGPPTMRIEAVGTSFVETLPGARFFIATEADFSGLDRVKVSARGIDAQGPQDLLAATIARRN